MDDSHFLKLALAEAERGLGFTAPNPAVGAVVVQDGVVLSRGYHRAAGQKHAEIEALDAVSNLENATLYVTLEPCAHWGRTPPCTEAILKRGVKNVVYGFEDPNPLVSGKGASFLAARGIPCEKVAVGEIEKFYAPYRKWTQKKMPFVTAKLALSLDGKLAYARGRRAQITGEAALRFTHERRRQSDAILTTVQTVLNDDPELNIRLTAQPAAKPIYILDSRLQFSTTAKLNRTAAAITLFHGPDTTPTQQQPLLDRGIRLAEVPRTEKGLDWKEILRIMAEDGKQAIWAEVGGKAFSTLLAQNQLDRAFLIYGPVFLGTEALSFPAEPLFTATSVSWTKLGQDGLCELGWE